MLTDKKILPKLEKIEQRYLQLIFERIADVPMSFYQTAEHLHAVPKAGKDVSWKPVKPGFKWGGDGLTGWLKGKTRLPKACAGRKVFVQAHTGGVETMLFVDGVPRGVFDPNHHDVMLVKRSEGGETFEIALEAHAGHSRPDCHPGSKGIVIARNGIVYDGVCLTLEREDVTAFVFDLMALRQLASALDENSLRRGKIIAGLAKVFALVDSLPEETGEASWRPKLEQARLVMRPLLQSHNGPSAPFIGLTGHSHLDTAWLWTIKETDRKCARTFANAINLMEQYPEFRFLQSTPYHADVVRRLYPALFQKMREMVRARRWEPNGAMWVEPDCNIPSGESFARQLLYGQLATREMFGYTSDTLWLPDVFGYSAALPQILRAAGVEFFCTAKMAWNDTTRFPYDTFVWRGIDGSPVITHLNNTHCWPDPKTLIGHWNNVQHKDVQDRQYCSYGFGDGGGGPQFEMIEIARRVEDLEGCPRTQHISISEFMEGFGEHAARLPVWNGELYLELHRGTLTSVAASKRLNRCCESALRDAELLCSIALLRADAQYPAAPLRDLWKTLLTRQFHDILPGSSIAAVNDEAAETLSQTYISAACWRYYAMEALAMKNSGRAGKKNATHERTWLVANCLSWERTDELTLDDAENGLAPEDDALVSQRIEDVRGESSLVIAGFNAPPLGAAVLRLEKKKAISRPSPFKAAKSAVETPFALVRFDRHGRIASFTEKSSLREIVRKGGALNTFLLGEDVPAAWDNWDIDRDHMLKMRPDLRLIDSKVVTDGPVQLRIRSTYKIGERSTIAQDMVFHSSTPRVDFQTLVDWKEKHQLLKAGFEFDILSDFARHEIQYGHVERSTHNNQSDDRAQFEVCAHKWTDLSENAFGVALLNDCKYGVSAKNGELRLSLLKSGTHPDPRGDQGCHFFTYSLLPHACGFSVESVVRPAYELNNGAVAYLASTSVQPLDSLLTVSAPNVIVESVKQSEDGKGIVIRMYEAGKTGTYAGVHLGFDFQYVSEANLLEEHHHPLQTRAGAVNLYFRPFEIKTLYCRL